MFSLICVWTNVWVNNRDACDLRRNRDHHDVTTHRNTHPRNQSSHMTNSFSVSVHNLFTQRALEIFSKWNILNDITPLFLQLSSMLLHPTCPKFQSRSLDILNDPSVLCYMKHIKKLSGNPKLTRFSKLYYLCDLEISQVTLKKENNLVSPHKVNGFYKFHEIRYCPEKCNKQAETHMHTDKH